MALHIDNGEICCTCNINIHQWQTSQVCSPRPPSHLVLLTVLVCVDRDTRVTCISSLKSTPPHTMHSLSIPVSSSTSVATGIKYSGPDAFMSTAPLVYPQLNFQNAQIDFDWEIPPAVPTLHFGFGRSVWRIRCQNLSGIVS